MADLQSAQPELKPAYLIHGDDHGALAERRAGLRSLAESGAGAAGVQVIAGDQATPAGVAAALCTMTLATGHRVLIVEGVERWRQAEIERDLAPVMSDMPPDTTLALFAYEEARAKAPEALHKAVKRAGGQIVQQSTVKPWELPRWAQERAARNGIMLDAAAAKALVAQVGERQQRLARELEKLALELDVPGAGSPGAGEPVRVSAAQIELRAARSSAWRAYVLADALVAGDAPAATVTYLRLRYQGERLAGMVYLIAGRLREAIAVAERLQAGESRATVKRSLRMPPRAAGRFVEDVAARDPARLRAALAALADLELDTRGGAVLTGARMQRPPLGEDTLALLAIDEMTGA